MGSLPSLFCDRADIPHLRHAGHNQRPAAAEGDEGRDACWQRLNLLERGMLVRVDVAAAEDKVLEEGDGHVRRGPVRNEADKVLERDKKAR